MFFPLKEYLTESGWHSKLATANSIPKKFMSPTSKRDAKKASKLLRTSKSPAVKSVAGSDLSQARRRKKKR